VTTPDQTITIILTKSEARTLRQLLDQAVPEVREKQQQVTRASRGTHGSLAETSVYATELTMAADNLEAIKTRLAGGLFKLDTRPFPRAVTV
jgi:predicted LPLAT superfamily acyltransferase